MSKERKGRREMGMVLQTIGCGSVSGTDIREGTTSQTLCTTLMHSGITRIANLIQSFDIQYYSTTVV